MESLRYWKLAARLLLLSLPLTSSSAATYTVSSISELNTRISSAVAGDTIIVQNGLYTTSSSISVTRVGTAANPIVIRAGTIGGVEIAGTSAFSLSSPAAYITIQGFKFTDAGSINISSGTSHCRFTRNIVELSIPATNDVSYINISGDDVEIDRNELRNKSTLGNMLDVTGSGSQVARRLWVHHNYFHDFVSPGGNGAETIRLGLSGLSLSTGSAIVEYNLFLRCDGENEMISNKSSGNTYRYNTVLDSPGGEMSQRHGNDCLYYGNYMRNTQGMRVYGDRHRIFNNYFESNSIGVNMGNGDGDVYNGDPLTSHDRPDDNIVVFNTFLNNATHYQMGGRTGGLGSSNTVVANNIFQGGGTMASISSSAPYTGTWSNNIRWQTSSAGNMPASGYTNVNPLLAADANGEYHVQPGSPAINTGVGSYDYYGAYSSYSFVTADMDGQPRDNKPDIGADEFSGAPILARILTTNDVGPNSSTSTFNLVASPASLTVPPGVFTNVSYAINVTDVAGSNATITLSLWGLPTGTAAAFVPPSVTGSGVPSLNVTVSNSAPVGYYTMVITGVSTNSTNVTTAVLIIARPAASLRWISTNSPLWDVGTTANWYNPSNSGADVFMQGDSVLFDDTAGAVTNIALNVSAMPAVLTNDSTSRSFTISGGGSLGGSVSIVKKGASALTLSTANDFSGTVTISAGTLKAGIAGALGSSAGATIISGGTLDVNGINFTGEPVTVSGGGAGGQGAVVNNGADQTSALRNVTLAGDTTFGGTRRWDIRASSSSSTNGCSLISSGQPYRITKVGTNQVSLVAVSVDTALGDIDVKEGVFAIQTVTSQVGNPARTITVLSNATLNLWNLNTAPLNKRVVLSNGAAVWNESGSSVVIGPVILTNGVSTFNIGGTSLTISNNILSGPGGLTKIGAGTLYLRGANSYTGQTLVSTGTLALVSSGSITASSGIIINGGAIFDVTQRGDGTLTLASGQILGGNGTIYGSLSAGQGSIVSPGTSIGGLTVTNGVSFQGTMFMELSKSAGTNDTIIGAKNIVYGGTLQLTNVAGQLAAGDSFKLFSATNYSGAFTNIIPAIPALNLGWDTSTLTSDGTLRIVSAPTSRPRLVASNLDGTSFLINGSNGVPGWPYCILASTNLVQPIANWARIATNQFDSAGGFSYVAAVDPGTPQEFYLLELQ